MHVKYEGKSGIRSGGREIARLIRHITYALVIIAVLALPGAAPGSLEYNVYRVAYRDYFNVLGWMARDLALKVAGGQDGSRQAKQEATTADGAELVKRYLKLNEQIDQAAPRAGHRAQPTDAEQLRKLIEERDRLEPQAQTILREQLVEALREEGFTSTVAGRTGVYPSPLFAFTPLPYILIVSPRNNIRIATSLALQPNLTRAAAEAIEDQASKMNVSGLVVPIGGLGSYPPMIPRTSSLEFLAHTISHEWTHNYLTFRPLGFRYTLQIENDYNVVTMNESTASIVGEEVGDLILSKYYGYPPKEHPRRPEPQEQPEQPNPPVESDFNKRMRAIRLKVDDYLAKGQIAEAEKYMGEEQKKLQADGFDVRKLNQAYFAFYGSYATSPGFTNPLGDAVAELRYESPSLKAFVDRIERMRSYDELKKTVGARERGYAGLR